jgi:hypothetical protein
LTRLDLATLIVSATVFTGNYPVVATASATWVFWAGLLQGFAEDLGLHGLASEEAFKFADAVLELPDAAEGDDLLVGPDGLVPTLGHAAPPLEQEAGPDAVEPGDGRDRQTWLHGLPGCMVCSTSRTFSSAV